MTEKKRRQGQKKGDRTATPKKTCPRCGEYLKTAWVVENRKMQRIGLSCPSRTCDYIVKDPIEQEEEQDGETESINEPEND